MSKALFISVNGNIEVREFSKEQEYKVISTAVGGFVEAVSLPKQKVVLWVNEEGKLRDLELNTYGTALWANNFGLTDWIAGDIIITGETDEEGYSTGLTDEQISLLSGGEIIL